MAATDRFDLTGVDLPDRQAALTEARERAVWSLRDGFALGEDRRDWVLVVRDEGGVPLLKLTLGEAAGASLAALLS